MCTWDVWVFQSSGDFPLIHLQLQGVHFIYIPWYPEGPWRRGKLYENVRTFEVYFLRKFSVKFWAFSPLASSQVCILAFLFRSFHMTSRESFSSSHLKIPSVWSPLRPKTSSDRRVCTQGSWLSGYRSFWSSITSSKDEPNIEGVKIAFLACWISSRQGFCKPWWWDGHCIHMKQLKQQNLQNKAEDM